MNSKQALLVSKKKNSQKKCSFVTPRKALRIKHNSKKITRKISLYLFCSILENLVIEKHMSRVWGNDQTLKVKT